MLRAFTAFFLIASAACAVFPIDWNLPAVGANVTLGRVLATNDVLNFFWNSGTHNVVEVDKASFDTCNFTASSIIKIYQGNTPGNASMRISVNVSLSEGVHYLVCTIGANGTIYTYNTSTGTLANLTLASTHCNRGLKVLATVHKPITPGSVEDLTQKLFCGFPAGNQNNATWNSKVAYPNGHVCASINGLAADPYTWLGLFGDEAAASYFEATSAYVSSALSDYDEYLKSAGAITPCPTCRTAYAYYLCLAITPQPGCSKCAVSKFWNWIRTQPVCNSACANVSPCNSSFPVDSAGVDCCYCAIGDNDTACSSKTEEYSPSTEDFLECNPVPKDVCTNVFTHCLGSTTKATTACKDLSTTNWVNYTRTPAPTTVCDASFTNMLNYSFVNDDGEVGGLPAITLANCTWRNVTGTTTTTCRTNKYINQRICNTRTTRIPPRMCCVVGNGQNCFKYSSSNVINVSITMVVLALFSLLF